MTHAARRLIPCLVAAFLTSAPPALAQVGDLGQMADRLTGQASPIASLITVFSFLFGVFLVMVGLWKFHTRAEAGGRGDPSSRPAVSLTYIFAGAMAVALPSLLNSAVTTLFGTTSQSVVTDALGRGNVVPFRGGVANPNR